MEQTTIRIDGMTCGGCVRSVTDVLKRLPSATAVTVDLAQAQASLSFDPARLSIAQIKAAVDDAGFQTS